MPVKKSVTPREVKNPFSEGFLPHWELWKEYKWVEFKFKYRSAISEQAALNNLAKLSDGNEEIASEIMKQSMGNGWQGFFPLKTININHGRTQQQSGGQNSSRESLNDLYNKRFGGG
jgi:hypothetical protein